MGGAGRPNPDRSAEVIAEAVKHPNMMLVGSEIPTEKIKIAIDTLGSERVMYGSDSPVSKTLDALSNYEILLKDYDDDVKESILYRNALRVFGLK
jgi:predicted TIM-barrel fold metal-dependent hydrolase